MRRYFQLMLISGCLACGHDKHASTASQTSASRLPLLSESSQTKPAAPVTDTSTVSTSNEYPAYLLNVSTYHSDEVEDNVEQRTWFGLFKNVSGYYIGRCRLMTKRIEDPVDVPDGELAWDISTITGTLPFF